VSFVIDRSSLLVDVPGTMTLAAIEQTIGVEELTLGLAAMPDTTVADWLAAGAPGAPPALVDPADHLLAGLTATLKDGRILEVLPGPRRAVGPDLVALFVGANDRFGRIERAWLRVHLRTAAPVRMSLPAYPLDPPLNDGESALLSRIERELLGARGTST